MRSGVFAKLGAALMTGRAPPPQAPHRLRRARRRAAPGRRWRRAHLPRRLERQGDAERGLRCRPIRSARAGQRADRRGRAARRTVGRPGRARRGGGGDAVITEPHRGNRPRRSRQGADQRRSVEDGRHVGRLDPANGRGSASVTSWSRRWRRATWPPRRRGRRAARRASIRRPSTASSSARSRATARSRPRRPSCRRSWAPRSAAARSTCRPPAPASSTACRSRTHSSARGSSSGCWSSASRCSRASSTGPTATPACCSATAPARCCWSRTTSGRGILSTHLYADGSLADILCSRRAAAGSRLTPRRSPSKRHFVKMNGREVYKHAVRTMAAASKTALEPTASAPDDVDLGDRAPGQPAHPRGGARARRHPDRRGSSLNIERYGNTSSASLPTALDEAIEQGRIKDGDAVAVRGAGRRAGLGARRR